MLTGLYILSNTTSTFAIRASQPAAQNCKRACCTMLKLRDGNYKNVPRTTDEKGKNEKHKPLTMAKKHRGFGGKLEVQSFD